MFNLSCYIDHFAQWSNTFTKCNSLPWDIFPGYFDLFLANVLPLIGVDWLFDSPTSMDSDFHHPEREVAHLVL